MLVRLFGMHHAAQHQVTIITVFTPRAGHNGCLQCMAHVQRAKPECPLCRAAFSATTPLVVNHELRDLVKLTSTLHTVDGTDDGWQTLAAVKPKVLTQHRVEACMR